MIELKPCPFCGATAHVSISDCEMGRKRYMAYTECDNMDCEAVIDTELFEDENQAKQKVIELWNRRVSDENQSKC
jgi:Lar family restriction alleviation protein